MADPSKTIIIAGSPRSGTTLLLDLLGASLKYRKVFEPLHPLNVKGAQNFYYLYVRPEEDRPDLESFMKKALTGKINTPWTNEMGIVKDVKTFLKMLLKIHKWRWWAPNRIMKIIRGNLMLGWLEKTFGCKIVFIMRHPCAVIESQKRIGWEKDREAELIRVVSQVKLIEDYLQPFQRDIERIVKVGDYWEKSALLWSIENMVPLKQMKAGHLHALLIFYENLILNPREEAAKIEKYTGIKKINLSALLHPSSTADKRTFSTSKKKMLAKWKDRLLDEEASKILSIVKKMEIPIYDYDLLPHL